MTYALITGASKGIGKAIAEELARRKFNVILIARSETLLKQVAQHIENTYQVKADYLAIDLSSTNASDCIYRWCLEKNYDLQVLVNNAGYGLSGPFQSHSVDENTGMMQVNMIAMVQLCQLFLPELQKQPRAYILNIASTTAYQAIPYFSIYAAAKIFVINFTRALKRELKQTSVSVTCVSPGSTDTDFPVRAQVKEKVIKMGKKVNMTPEAVAKIAVNSMLAGKTEVITGFINKVGAFLAWLAPKSISEKAAMRIYK